MTEILGKLTLRQRTAPGTPAANKIEVYGSSVDDKLHTLDDAAVDTALGSGVPTVKATEVDMGTGTRFKKFAITDAGVAASSRITAYQAHVAATGRNVDENELDRLHCTAAATGVGTFDLFVQSLKGGAHGLFVVHYVIGSP